MTGPRRCTHCQRILIAQHLWRKYTPDERRNLYATHAEHVARGLCRTGYRWVELDARRKREEADLPYDGDWVRVGMILRPTGDQRQAS